MSNAIAEPAMHRHGCKHRCRCAAPKASECQKCSRDRMNKELAKVYAQKRAV